MCSPSPNSFQILLTSLPTQLYIIISLSNKKGNKQTNKALKQANKRTKTSSLQTYSLVCAGHEPPPPTPGWIYTVRH